MTESRTCRICDRLSFGVNAGWQEGKDGAWCCPECWLIGRPYLEAMDMMHETIGRLYRNWHTEARAAAKAKGTT